MIIININKWRRYRCLLIKNFTPKRKTQNIYVINERKKEYKKKEKEKIKAKNEWEYLYQKAKIKQEPTYPLLFGI